MTASRTSVFGSAVRRAGFWTLDTLKGGSVRGQYRDVRRRMTEGVADGDAIARLLDHASSTTPFYRPYARGSLLDFPVVDKATLKAEGPRFRSELFAGSQLHRKSTSGSTGSPLSVVQDPGKRTRHIADTIYFNEIAGQRVGDRLMWIFAARLLPISRWQRLSRNIVAVDHVGMDDAVKQSIIEMLRRTHGTGILSISSTLHALARYATSRGHAPDELGVRVVISSGETLLPGAKSDILAAFGCPVVDRYANEENGILACTRPGDDRLFLNRASYHFEFLRPDRDEPQDPGHRARIVVTDLFNGAMPMVRYDTGDLAIVADDADQAGPTALLSVEGRRADVIFDTSGGQVSGTSASAIIAKSFPELERYQLIQDGPASYTLRIVWGGASHRGPELQAVLRKWLGADAMVAIDFVESIPSGPNGKHRPVICRLATGREGTASEQERAPGTDTPAGSSAAGP